MSGQTRRPPAAYVLGLDGPSVELPGWVCDWLERHTDLPQQRVTRRGVDPAVDDVLVAVREVAMRWRQASSAQDALPGTSLAATPEPVSSLVMPSGVVGVSAAARLIGISSSAVRRACRQQRLKASRSPNGDWSIDEDDARTYAARRRAA